MIQQQELQNKIEITYAEEIQTLDANIIRTSKDFLDILDKQQNIVIEGDQDDQFVFSAGARNYKLRGIFLPTTMLVTPTLVAKLLTDNSNSQQANRPVSKVLLETTKYLKIEPHDIDFHLIYKDLEDYQLPAKILSQRVEQQQILEKEGVSVSELKSKYKLTPALIQKIATTGSFVFYKSIEDDDTILLQLSMGYLDLFLKQLLPFLTAQNKVGEWFSLGQIQDAIPPIDSKIFTVIAKYFKMEMDPAANAPSIACNEMEMERRYKLGLESMLIFFMLELTLAKQEYTEYEMEEALKTFKAIYIPFGHPEFTEQKVNQLLPEVIAHYFLLISRKEHAVYLHYNPLFMNVNIKARVQEMAAYKKRFSLFQIKGLFSSWYGEQDVNQILLKNFRKMGKDYQIKLIIPKGA